jgi:NDP-mannose synthase
MHAVILAGGKGTRLRPYTTSLPKPLVPIGDQYTILEIVLRQLRSCGFDSVTLAIGHLGYLISSYVGDGSRWGMRIQYAVEESPLGTIGPLLPLLDGLPDQFLVMNGDILTDLDFGDLLRTHTASGAGLTVATAARNVHVDFGVLHSSGGVIDSFREKPVIDYRVSMGVYGLDRDILAGYPIGMPLGFDSLVKDLLSGDGPPLEYPYDGYWLDIGRPDDYDRANAEFEVLKPLLLGEK